MLRTAILVALLLAFLPMPASSQEAPGQVLTDASADVNLILADAQAVPDAGTLYSCADLVSLGITEAHSDLTFTLTVDDLKEPNQDTGADGCRYHAYFTHNGREFRLTMFRTLPAIAGSPFADLSYRDTAEAEWSDIWATDADARWDLAADTYAVTVAREAMADADGAAPFPGRSLEAIRVEALSSLGGATILSSGLPVPAVPWPAYAQDFMPDDAAQAATFPIQVGVAQTGHARLSSQMPFRSSNGEATTFLYNVTATNLGDAVDSFELEATGVPAGYSLVLPVPVVKLEAGDDTAIPVLLTMPFGHQHGALTSFILEMRSLSDAGSVGRLEMGVRFLAIPQPAGHHDTVYLHTTLAQNDLPVFNTPPGYLNTQEEDPNDQKVNYYSGGLSGNGATWTSNWDYPLQPALEMGLDVDPAKLGVLRVPVGTTLPMLQATMSATLFVGASNFGFFFGDEDGILATAGPTDPVDISANSQVLMEAELVPVEGGLRVPYEPGNTLWLYVEVTFTGPATLGLTTEGVYIAPGGSAVLPLREWHDSVDEALSNLGGPGLSPLGAQERLFNPGEAVVFPVSIANPLDEDVKVEFEVSGGNSAWATLPDGSVTVPAHGTAQASVIVRAPASSVDQERADLVLQAFSKDHPEARSLLRLVAEVDTDLDHVDDTAVADNLVKKESPAMAPLLAGLVLLAFAVLRRR
ncbi:MAG: hypothetical protein WC876_08775 [Candidatus Thermoplasmatota archaeon]|jgi:hypothetical protein